tara:strand:+ start:349 stop:570 length:222 start_codon:yes stop_codon:yes gene_type:complete
LEIAFESHQKTKLSLWTTKESYTTDYFFSSTQNKPQFPKNKTMSTEQLLEDSMTQSNDADCSKAIKKWVKIEI